MHRNAGRDRRSPRSVGAGVEVGSDVHGDELAVLARAGARTNARWMPLGRAHDGLDPRVSHFHGAVKMPCCQCDKRLHGEIELGAESAPDCGWDNANAVSRERKDGGEVGTIHVWRLRTSLDFHSIADSPRKTSLRFDAGMLDETGFILAFHDHVGLGKSLLD